MAVLGVVVYHARTSLLPGGFVGVDVFFVISGFLISANIFTRLDRQTFSLLDFYRRRVQRIAPAMFVVVAATLAAAYWLLLPKDATDVARSAVFAVGSLANVYFWRYRDRGYFAGEARELPLLHLWSLGVEEQFYLVWPVVLLAVGRRWRSPGFMGWSVSIAAASFALGDLLFSWDPSFVYYLMPTRAGELLVGAIVSAAVLGGRDKLRPSGRSWLGFLGACGIGFSLIQFDHATVFPGVRALLPTLGTAALLLAGAGSNQTAMTRLLASKPLVAIGLISYSVYLWHWPVMAFFRYGYGDPSVAAQWALPLIGIVLGAISYALVEQPARAARFPPLRTIVVGYALPAAVIAAAGIWIVRGPRLGLPVYDERYLARLTALSDKTRPAYDFEYVCQSWRLSPAALVDPRCIVGARMPEPRAVLWGDSNAAHYIGVLGRAAERGGFSFRNAEMGSCPPVLADPAPFVEAERLVDCRQSIETASRWVERFPVVMLGASWTAYDQRSPAFFPALVDTVNRLVERGAFVVLLGKMPTMPGYDGRCPEKELNFPFLTCPTLRLPLADDIKRMNARLKALSDGRADVGYFDVTPYLCPDGWCTSTDEKGDPLYYDSSHISMSASWKLGTRIQERHGMPTALAEAVVVATGPGKRPEEERGN